jgi:hypothetical protein
MRSVDDGAFEWIRAGRQKALSRNDPSWRGNFLFHLMPNTFDSYAKILHGIEAKYTNIDDPHPLTEREVQILKIPACTELRSFVENLRKEGQGPRIRWATLARLIGVPFEADICHGWFRATISDPVCWPRFLCGPGQGTLNTKEILAVLSLLRAVTGEQECFFRFAEWTYIGTNEPILFRGALEQLPTFLVEKNKQFTPEYWWPSDRSWCLCSEYDLDFTFVGGSRDLISAVLKDAILESLEVTSRTRIDSLAPMPR